jgi:uncharacterized damage-inducible protein DinB
LLDTIRRQVGHQAWADGRVLASLERSGGEPARAREVFAHVLGAQHVWLRRIAAQPSELDVWPTLDVPACRRWTARNGADFDALLAGLDEASYGRAVTYRNSAGDRFTSTVADILEHVVLHSAYHRGQVALLVRGAGFEPAPTDFIALRRGSDAATRR